jgi:hypothetical protein
MKRPVESEGRRHDPALQALAIREATIYVTQRQPLPDSKVRGFLDVEGLTVPDRYYLIGLRIVEGDVSRQLDLMASLSSESYADRPWFDHYITRRRG